MAGPSAGRRPHPRQVHHLRCHHQPPHGAPLPQHQPVPEPRQHLRQGDAGAVDGADGVQAGGHRPRRRGAQAPRARDGVLGQRALRSHVRGRGSASGQRGQAGHQPAASQGCAVRTDLRRWRSDAWRGRWWLTARRCRGALPLLQGAPCVPEAGRNDAGAGQDEEVLGRPGRSEAVPALAALGAEPVDPERNGDRGEEGCAAALRDAEQRGRDSSA